MKMTVSAPVFFHPWRDAVLFYTAGLSIPSHQKRFSEKKIANLLLFNQKPKFFQNVFRFGRL